MYKGIDVSKWQGSIDWSRVKKAGIQFAMIRSSFGWGTNNKDNYFEKNYKNAKAVGMPVGAYHYSYAMNPEEAKKEAELCLSVLKGKKFEYPIAFDIEENKVFALGKTKVSEIIKAFCETLENAGYYVVIYANKYSIENYFTDEIFKKYDLWVAQWSDKCTLKQTYGMWQNSSKGQVDGITGYVDTDFAYKNYMNIMKSTGLNGFSKPATTQKTETPKTESPKFKKGDKVKVQNPINYDTGKKFKLYYKIYEVLEPPKNNRIVIGVDGVVTSAIHVKYLTKV